MRGVGPTAAAGRRPGDEHDHTADYLADGENDLQPLPRQAEYDEPPPETSSPAPESNNHPLPGARTTWSVVGSPLRSDCRADCIVPFEYHK